MSLTCTAYQFATFIKATIISNLGINKYFEIVETDFEIYGEMQNEWELYIKGKDYWVHLKLSH